MSENEHGTGEPVDEPIDLVDVDPDDVDAYMVGMNLLTGETVIIGIQHKDQEALDRSQARANARRDREKLESREIVEMLRGLRDRMVQASAARWN